MSGPVVIFDVNETLLDTGALAEPFRLALGAADARIEWFDRLLRMAMAATLRGHYHDFSSLGRAALAQVAADRGRPLDDATIGRLMNHMGELPAYGDARPALERLRGAGFRVAALTNSAPAAADAQLRHAGLMPCLDAVLSVEAVGRFKPAPEPYCMAAERLEVPVHRLWMVAVHDWDIAGAMAAGCRGVFVARDGRPFDPLAPQPEVIAADLEAAAEAVVKLQGAAASPGQ